MKTSARLAIDRETERIYYDMQTPYCYKKTDAFTANNSLGNPAACLYLKPDQSLNEQQMLDIAKQHKGYVSEVIYCQNNDEGIHLTYYSSECEVDFCGHGTVACMYGLIKDNPELLEQAEIPVMTNKKGPLVVYNRIAEHDTVLIAAPKPVYIGTQLDYNTVSAVLGVDDNAVDTNYPIDIIDAGLRTLIVPLRYLETEISTYPNEQDLKQFCMQNDIDIILIFSQEVDLAGHIAHTRVFAPRFGYLEDPATGSGNSAFGYYMLKNELWDGSDCCIEQGGNNRVFNDVYLSYMNDMVHFGGSATVRVEGVHYIE